MKSILTILIMIVAVAAKGQIGQLKNHIRVHKFTKCSIIENHIDSTNKHRSFDFEIETWNPDSNNTEPLNKRIEWRQDTKKVVIYYRGIVDSVYYNGKMSDLTKIKVPN